MAPDSVSVCHRLPPRLRPARSRETSYSIRSKISARLSYLPPSAPLCHPRAWRDLAKRLIRRRSLDEARNVSAKLVEIGFVEIHHVTRIVVFQLNVAAQFFRKIQVIHSVLGCEEWGREIVVTVFDLDFQIRVVDQRLAQIALDIRRDREKARRILAFPVLAPSG